MTAAFGDRDGAASVGVLFQMPPDGLLVSRLTFPDDENPPPENPQRLFVAAVPGDVVRELLGPERNMRFGRVCVATSAVPMPETPVYENNQPVSGKNHIRTTRNIFPVQAEAET